MKILIIADDLSGSADCAVACVQAGLRTMVAFDGSDEANDEAGNFDVVTVDADTRGMSAYAAAATQAARLKRLLKPRPPLLYKKIDSTLRGHFVDELAATAEFCGTPVFAPSFPAMGRTMVGGEVRVKGVPLKETEVWQHARIDGPSTAPEMFAAAGFKPVVVTTAPLRGDPQALQALFAEHIGQPGRIIICDAESEDDMARIARATAPLAERCFWVGSGGLMRHLPAALGFSGKAAPTVAARGTERAILAVVGSVSSISRRQSKHLAETLAVPLLSIDPELLRGGAAHPQWDETQRQILAPMTGGRGLVLTIAAASPDLSEGPRLAAALARLLKPSWEKAGGLILTGGETARALLMDWGIAALELIGEVEPGVPLSCTAGARRVPVVTKAGAFGDENCLTRAWRMIEI